MAATPHSVQALARYSAQPRLFLANLVYLEITRNAQVRRLSHGPTLDARKRTQKRGQLFSNQSYLLQQQPILLVRSLINFYTGKAVTVDIAPSTYEFSLVNKTACETQKSLLLASFRGLKKKATSIAARKAVEAYLRAAVISAK